MSTLNNLIVYPSSTILEVLKIIDQGSMQIAIIVNKDKKVIGTITDGDIRRALLNGATTESPIENIYFKNPTLANINDSKESIIHKAISKQLYQIPIVNNDGYLIAIENLSTLLKNTSRKNKVYIMAGGLGTRLKPLTNTTPKPMLNVGDKPILETIIENFVKYGFTDITISVNYKSNIIKDHFQNGETLGANITYIEENKRLGTAGALSLVEDLPNEPFFVMNADLLTNVNFLQLLNFHIQEKSTATMCVREYDFQVPYGVIKTNGSSITSIEEKPIHKFFVNAGIYVFSPDIFSFIPKDTFFDMPTLFNRLIENNLQTISFPIHEYWLDIGKMSDFEQAQSEYFRVFNDTK